MSLILKQPLTGPEVWRGRDLANDQSWAYHWSESDIASLDDALQQFRTTGKHFPEFDRSHFRLHGLDDTLESLADELENGRGFIYFKGLPIHRYSEDDINVIYYGLGLSLGLPVTQNPAGDLLGKVMNVGDLKDKNTRVYETNAYLPYHTDPSDVFGLLCVRKAKAGGLNSLVSVASVYNRILTMRPELLGLFYRPVYYAHLGENLPTLSPLFSYHKNKLTCRYLRQYIELGHEVMKLPLSRVEIEALDLFDAIAHDEELRLDMMMEPGDMVFANNYMIMHSRTGFEEYDEPERRRKLLRLWLKMPNARELAPDFPGRNGFGVPAWLTDQVG